MPVFVPTVPRREMAVDAIVTVHYFEYAKNYVFEGEKHDFWELLYVDKGEVEVMGGQHRLPSASGRDDLPQAQRVSQCFRQRSGGPQSRGGILCLPFSCYELL